MITSLLVEHPWVSPALLFLLIVAGVVGGPWLAEHPRVARWCAGIALVPVVLLTLVPTNREVFARCTVEWAVPTPSRVELAANVVLFVAPVFLAGVALRRPLRAFALGLGTSLAIEAVQAAVPALGRSCSTNDWSANAIGAAIGALLAWLALARVRSRRSSGA